MSISVDLIIPPETKHVVLPISNLIKIIVDSSFRRNVKYTIEDYVIGIIDVLKNYQSWNSYNGKINSDTLRKKYNEWCKLGIFEDAYKSSLEKYLKTTKITEELKYQWFILCFS